MASRIKSILYSSSLLFLISACGSHKQDELEVNEDDFFVVGIDSQKISAQNVFNTIPSRATILNLTKEAKSEYNVEFLNSPDNVNNYSLESSRALNLGVYGADLNIANIYDQTQESLLFFKCVSIIAKTIGLRNSFDEHMGDRMIANQSNRDSTLNIVTQAFQSADYTLRINNRPGVSSLLVAGAWVEGLYIACQTAKQTKNESIIKEIYKQKASLDNLLSLLKSSELPVETRYIVIGLQDIKKIMDEKTDNLFTVDVLKDLDSKVTTIRTKIITSK